MKKAKLLFTLLVLFSFTITQAQVWEGDYYISSQEDVDNFPTECNCTEIDGDLRISDSYNATDDINNLDGLSELTTINNDLKIIWADSLTHIDGLSSLNHVGNNLTFDSNKSILNIDGLMNLIYIGGELELESNESLLNVDGLINAQIDSSIYIFRNKSLENVDGFSNITVCNGHLAMVKNESLHNLNGFSNLTFVNGGLSIFYSHLYNLSDLANVSYIGGELEIEHNLMLNSVRGLSNLFYVGAELEIDSNPNLENLVGLHGLNQVGWQLEIRNCLFTNLDELSNLQNIGKINLSHNPFLANIDGLSNIDSTLAISIDNNPSLTDIAGLSNLVHVEKNVTIVDNSNLNACCPVNCWIENDVVQEELWIENNATNCNSISEIEENCEDYCHVDCVGLLGGLAMPGSPCDDGNPQTLNDTYQSNCECVGDNAPIITDISTLNIRSFSLSPIPANNSVQLSFTTEIPKELGYEVYNLNGELVLQADFQTMAGNNDLNISIEDWPVGVYLIRIGDGEHGITRRIVKQ